MIREGCGIWLERGVGYDATSLGNQFPTFCDVVRNQLPSDTMSYPGEEKPQLCCRLTRFYNFYSPCKLPVLQCNSLTFKQEMRALKLIK